jgi:hypothetical protein
MSDFKSIKQLCEENPNLNKYILSLADEIDKLYKMLYILESGEPLS